MFYVLFKSNEANLCRRNLATLQATVLLRHFGNSLRRSLLTSPIFARLQMIDLQHFALRSVFIVR